MNDVGAATGFDTGPPKGCKGKVDLLFVISRLGTMHLVQEQFLASLPGFVQTIEERLEDFDVHIMVANPDGVFPGYEVCEHGSCIEYFPTCGPYAEDWVCGESAQLWEPCDEVLGAGLDFNSGAAATNKPCELYQGNRYIVDGQPELNDALECIAKVGWSGGAAIGDALIAAVSPKLNGPGGCNEGFLRDDALLVVVLISNVYDQESLSSVKVQYDKVIAAKRDPSSVVMLAITSFPPKDGQPKDPNCIYDDTDKGNFLGLLEYFPYYLRGDDCAPSYVPFFDEAVSMIDVACGSFVPG